MRCDPFSQIRDKYCFLDNDVVALLANSTLLGLLKLEMLRFYSSGLHWPCPMA